MENNMITKRILSTPFVLIVSSSILLTACGATATPEAITAAPTATETSVPSPTVVPATEAPATGDPNEASAQHKVNLEYTAEVVASDLFTISYNADGATSCDTPWQSYLEDNNGTYTLASGWEPHAETGTITCTWPDGSTAEALFHISVSKAILELDSATISNGILQVSYYKNFSDCVNPYLRGQTPGDGKSPERPFYWDGILCDPAGEHTVNIPLSDLQGNFEVGRKIALHHPSDFDNLVSETVTIK